MVLPTYAQAWLQARETSEAGLCLLTIHHPMMETFRLVKNTADIVSRGDTYSKAPFDLDVPNDDDQPIRSTLALPNVDRAIGIELRKIVDPVKITFELVGAAHLDQPVYRAALLEIRNIKVDELTISGDLMRHDDGAETCGTKKITPALAPALFRRR